MISFKNVFFGFCNVCVSYVVSAKSILAEFLSFYIKVQVNAFSSLFGWALRDCDKISILLKELMHKKIFLCLTPMVNSCVFFFHKFEVIKRNKQKKRNIESRQNILVVKRNLNIIIQSDITTVIYNGHTLKWIKQFPQGTR